MLVNGPTTPRRLHLLDLTALVIGYGLAALLIRAFWPATELPSPAVGVVLGLVYLWLGLAMSGPLVLVHHHRAHPGDPASAAPRTWAETAWLMIGSYWIGLTILAVPVR